LSFESKSEGFPFWVIGICDALGFGIVVENRKRGVPENKDGDLTSVGIGKENCSCGLSPKIVGFGIDMGMPNDDDDRGSVISITMRRSEWIKSKIFLIDLTAKIKRTDGRNAVYNDATTRAMGRSKSKIVNNSSTSATKIL
jgi:hypothetical protein